MNSQSINQARHVAARAYVELVVRKSNLKPSPLAQSVGLAPSTLNKHFAKAQPKSPPDIETLLALKNKYGVPFTRELVDAYGLGGGGLPTNLRETGASHFRQEVDLERTDVGPVQSFLKDVPILGTALCSSDPGDFFVDHNGEPIDHVRRPPGIARANDVFAVHLQNDSMLPWYKPGHLIFLSEKRPPVVQGLVVVELWPKREGDSAPALFKLLVRRTAEYVELQQANPPKTFKVKTSDIKHIYRVLEPHELLGI